jgi:hypothetical protein
MVSVWSNTTKVLGSNPTTKNDKNDKDGTRYDRHDEGEVHENREREGGPRTAETWYVSRHFEPRTEVRRGGTPKVRKL